MERPPSLSKNKVLRSAKAKTKRRSPQPSAEPNDRWVRDTYQRVVSNWCQTLRQINKVGD